MDIMQLLMRRERILIKYNKPVEFMDHKKELDELYATFARTLAAVEKVLPFVTRARDK